MMLSLSQLPTKIVMRFSLETGFVLGFREGCDVVLKAGRTWQVQPKSSGQLAGVVDRCAGRRSATKKCGQT